MENLMNYNNWIGTLPNDWKKVKIKHVFTCISGNGFPVEIQGIEKGDYPVLKASDISVNNGTIAFTSSNYITKLQSKNFNIIPKCSIVFPKIGEAMKKNNRTLLGVDACLDNNCQALIPNSLIDEKYALLLLSIMDMHWYDNGGTIPCINNLVFLNSLIPLPSLVIQKNIVRFLSSKIDNINEIIKNLNEEIKELIKYKYSLIYKCVSRGVNDIFKFKECKLEWIKFIPEHWNVARIGSVYKNRNVKVSDKDYPPLSVTMQGIVPQLESAAKTDAHDDRKLVCKGDFAINSRSDRRGSCGISPMDGSISLINTVLCPLHNMNPKYFNWLFHTVEFADEFYKWGHGIVDDLWTTNWQDMKNILIPQPPLDEQAEIAEFLDNKCAEIDSIISDKKVILETLEEYKKSIIYEYVTGKKEVPNE